MTDLTTKENNNLHSQNNSQVNKGVPSRKEVERLCEELKSNVDTDKFYDYYEERSWMIGGRPINDWTAVFRSWHKRELRQKPKYKALCRYEGEPVTAGDAEAYMHNDQEHLDKILAKLKKLGQQNAK